MRRVTTGSAETDKSLLSILLGFFGVTAAFFLLPKTVKYVIRRFVLSTLAEIVAVVIAALLTEKVVNLVGDHDEALERVDTEG